MIEPSIEGVFEAINDNGVCTILFIDQTKLCQQYVSSSWILEEAEIVTVDQEILDIFQIGKVPQYRFFLQGSEVANLIGTVPRDQLLEMKQKIFGNIRSIRG